MLNLWLRWTGGAMAPAGSHADELAEGATARWCDSSRRTGIGGGGRFGGCICESMERPHRRAVQAGFGAGGLTQPRGAECVRRKPGGCGADNERRRPMRCGPWISRVGGMTWMGSVRTIDGAGRTQPLCIGVAADGRRADRDGTGLFRVEPHGSPGAIRSDGSPFAHVRGFLGLSRLSAWWLALGLIWNAVDRDIPRTMGGINDCIGTSERSWSLARPNRKPGSVAAGLITNVPMKLWG